MEECIQGHGHKSAHVEPCRLQMDIAFVGSEKKSLIEQNSGETWNQNGGVVEEQKYTVDVQSQLKFSDALLKVQQETCEGERSKFQIIVGLDGHTFLCEVCDIKLPNSVSVEQHLISQQHTKKLARKAVSIGHIRNTVRELEGGKTGNIRTTSHNGFRCKLCNENIHATDVVSHVKGNTHQQKLKEMKLTNEKYANRSQEWKPCILQSIWNEIYAGENGKWSNIKCTSPETFCCEPCKALLSVHDVLAHVAAVSHQEAIRTPEVVHLNETLMRTANKLWEQMHDVDRTHQTYFKIDDIKVLYCTSCNVRIPATAKHLTEHIHGKIHMSTIVRNLLPQHPPILEQTTGLLEENSQNLKKTKTQTLTKEGMKGRCTSENLSDSKNSQPQIKSVVNSAQEILTKALLPKEEQVNKRTTTELCHQEDVKDEMQGDKAVSAPRIVVSGYPRSIGMDLLYCFFKDFGTISFVGVNGESAIIEFTEDDAVEKVLARRPLFLATYALTVKKLTPTNHMNTMDCASSSGLGQCFNQDSVSVHEILVSAFISQQSIQETLNSLCEVSKSMSDPKKDTEVCQFLERTFSEIFPGCKAYPFGSRLSGLALSGSDLDIFLDTGGMYNGHHRQDSTIQELIVSAVTNTLLDQPECDSVEGVPNARTPIVRFFHKSSSALCDLAFRHGLGCENTKLIKFYLSLDVRVRSVILFMKHWACLHKLTGPSNITDYALTWLVIFYLQEASGFGLPSVELLQRLHDGPVRSIAGWECSFSRCKSKVPAIRSVQSVPQLLHGIFSYYHNFNFSHNVVCPLIGYPVHKQYFSKPQSLPCAMDNYVCRVMKVRRAERFRTRCCMCVQDPFDLSHNITKGTSPAILNKFQILCGLTADLCAKFCS